MVACQVAHSLFRTPTKIARIRHPNYLRRADQLFQNSAIPIDVLISPEQVVCDYIQRLIEHPGALQVLDFADGKVQLVAVKAFHGGLLVGQELGYLRQHMPNAKTRVAAIFRKDRAILPRGNTIIEAEYVICTRVQHPTHSNSPFLRTCCVEFQVSVVGK